MIKETPDIIRHLYRSFNMRKADDALLVVSSNTKWANPWEGGYCFGHAEIAAFWKRYWLAVNVYGYPVQIRTSSITGLCEVQTLIVIRDQQGNCVDQSMIMQYFQIQYRRVEKFDLVKPGASIDL